MVTPAEDFGFLHGLHRRRPQRILMKDVFRKALFDCSTLDQVDRYLDDKMILQSRTDMHDMFADAQGRAQVVEVGDTDNRITPMTGAFVEKPDPAALTAVDRRGDLAEAARDRVKDRVLAVALFLLSIPVLFSVRQARSAAAGKA